MNENNNDNNNEQYEELTRTIEPEALKMGAVQRIVSIFTAPTALMQNIKTYPVILVPYLLCVIIGLASIPASLQWTDMYMRELSHISLELYGVDLSGWTDLQAMDVYGDFEMAGIVDIVATVGLGFGMIVGPLFAALIGAVLLIVVSKILRGSSRIGQWFSAYMHIYVITAIGGFVTYALIAATGNFLDMTSLAALLMPGGNVSMPMFNALSAVTIFSVWNTVLVYIAAKELNDFPAWKAGVVGLLNFVFGIGIYVATFAFTFIMWDFSARALGL